MEVGHKMVFANDVSCDELHSVENVEAEIKQTQKRECKIGREGEREGREKGERERDKRGEEERERERGERRGERVCV